ncbi:MAG: hypothetical protein HW374_483 [Bacteroidetes bacterium]|nr:hypothetical protein [Bacteroidota bacterium]
MKPQEEIDRENAKFWEELCGTLLAKRLGITDHTEESLQRFDEAYFRLYPYLATYMARVDVQDKKVLEIGLGFGSLGQRLAENASEYVGVDISMDPVEMMNHRIGMHGLRGFALKASAHLLPFEDESFDAVVSIGVFHHTGNIEKCVDESLRVLKPGGRLLAMVYNQFSYRQWLRWPLKTASAFFGGESNAVEYEQRRVYDSRLDGSAAPQTVFTSTHRLKEIFSAFSSFAISKENCDEISIAGFNIIPRITLLTILGRSAGLDLYVLATKGLR